MISISACWHLLSVQLRYPVMSHVRPLFCSAKQRVRKISFKLQWSIIHSQNIRVHADIFQVLLHRNSPIELVALYSELH